MSSKARWSREYKSESEYESWLGLLWYCLWKEAKWVGYELLWIIYATCGLPFEGYWQIWKSKSIKATNLLQDCLHGVLKLFYVFEQRIWKQNMLLFVGQFQSMICEYLKNNTFCLQVVRLSENLFPYFCFPFPFIENVSFPLTYYCFNMLPPTC